MRRCWNLSASGAGHSDGVPLAFAPYDLFFAQLLVGETEDQG